MDQLGTKRRAFEGSFWDPTRTAGFVAIIPLMLQTKAIILFSIQGWYKWLRRAKSLRLISYINEDFNISHDIIFKTLLDSRKLLVLKSRSWAQSAKSFRLFGRPFNVRPMTEIHWNVDGIVNRIMAIFWKLLFTAWKIIAQVVYHFWSR